MSSIAVAAATFSVTQVVAQIVALVGIRWRICAHLERERGHDRFVADLVDGLPPGASLYDRRADGTCLVLTVAPTNGERGTSDG